ncbi:class I adenylate-forming enzyme family protein [Caenimonas koreensis]|uniref:class I adenylate-forming enzyme family protein n=1 Tax=Caenimonas koreensis TaxID=367474 RepID=UPI002B26DC2A|nr:class I adenylate-forming enzyme family protein [Caenimonas koreensis]
MFYQQLAFWAKATPTAIASIAAGQRMTYAQALKGVDGLAAHFTAAGIRPGHRVIVPKVNHITSLLCQFALDKIGAATCILQGDIPDWVDKILAHRSSDDPRTVLIPRDLRQAPAIDVPVHEWKLTEPCRLKSSSGSTGRIKVISRSYGSTVEGTDATQFMMGVRHGMAVASLVSWAGPATTMKTIAWLHGATLVMPSRDEAIWPLLNEHRVSLLAASPVNLNMAIARGETFERVPGLSIYLFGGRASPTLVEHYRRHVTEDIVMTYGSTETGSLMMQPLRGMPAPQVTLGRVLPSRVVEVVAADGQAVPRGQTGLLRLQTRHLRHDGYVREGGVLHPLNEKDREWFQPGDLGFIDADGLVHVLGREDDVINMGGGKFLTSDLADAVERSGLATDQAALNVIASDGPSRACVAVVLKPGVTLAEIRAALKERFKTLNQVHIVPFAELPYLANGKVDYPQLRESIRAVLDGQGAQEVVG